MAYIFHLDAVTEEEHCRLRDFMWRQMGACASRATYRMVFFPSWTGPDTKESFDAWYAETHRSPQNKQSPTGRRKMHRASESKQSSAGRRPYPYWEYVHKEVIKKLKNEGAPNAGDKGLTELQNFMAECIKKRGQGRPAKSTLQKHVQLCIALFNQEITQGR